MLTTTSRFTIDKRHALTISRGTSSGSENVLVTVEHDGGIGLGEMAPSDVTGDTADSAVAALDEWASGALAELAPWQMQEIERRLGPVPRHGSAVRAALDMACHDWLARRAGMPLWQLLGLDRGRIPPTSVTVGINPPDVVREIVPEILARTGARILKVKLGSPGGADADRDLFAAAQEAAVSPLGGSAVSWRVDANGGWDAPTAVRMIAWLAERGVELVEQPLAEGDEGALADVHARSSLPIYADESVHSAADVVALAGAIDGVNLKLMKCGGIREALRIIHTAKACGLGVMIGCMGETSLAITAAAHLSPLVDHLDLDSHLNLRFDPFVGAAWTDGRVFPTDEPGLGVSERASAGANAGAASGRSRVEDGP
jgi:L-Ala-D/L-Glu epimerase